MKVYNIGYIGFGGMAGYHVSSIRGKYSRANVKGIYDLNPERGRAAQEMGLYSYSSKEELISDPEIDIVVVATTNEAHKDLVIEALRAGKSVLCEKPVTISSAELEEIMEVEKTSSGVFSIDQNRRTNDDFVIMREKVESGIIGKPYVIESRVEGSRGMPTGWRTIKRLGGGMMLDWGVHLIDQIMYMVHEKVTSVYCKMFSIQYPEVDDNFRLVITFESGLVAHIEVSTNNYITHPRWYVLGETGTLVINDWDCKGKIVRCIDKEDVWDEQIVYTKAGPTKTMAPRNENSTETIEITDTIDKKNEMAIVYDQLIDCMEGKAELKITSAQALRVMKVMEAAFESDKTGEAIKVSI